MKKIAVVEDVPALRKALAGLLRDHGYEVQEIQCFAHAAKEILEYPADLVLLDILLPGANGQEILRELRQKSNLPILMLTSKTGEMEEILSMSYGADDYITKPCNPTLLLLKIEAVFRRMKPAEQESVLEYHGIRLHLLKSTMEYQGRETILSRNESSILSFLIKHQGKIVSRDALMDYLWDCNDFVDDNTLTVNINRLRRKLEDAGLAGMIETRRKQGYLLK